MNVVHSHDSRKSCYILLCSSFDYTFVTKGWIQHRASSLEKYVGVCKPVECATRLEHFNSKLYDQNNTYDMICVLLRTLG